MNRSIPQSGDLADELTFAASLSGGPGGQHVNKVSSKVTLTWNAGRSEKLSPEQKEILLKKLSGRLTRNGVLSISSQESRSQSRNKEAVKEKLDRILVKALTPRKLRKSTKPTRASVQNRLDQKRRHSDKKKWRGKI